jgi:NADPH-dependent F420 reductase
MAIKQTIAIIGATGNMGSALAKSLAGGPYRVLLFARDAGKLTELANEISNTHPGADVEAIGCPVDASWEADIIIPAVPYNAEKSVVEKIRPVATGKVVVSISNPLTESYDGLVTAPGSSAAEELQELLPHAKVVKAFNTTYAADFARPLIGGQQVDAFIAGNDEEAVNTVERLAQTAGFNPVVAGDLPVSRTLEAMQLLLIRLTLKNGYNWHAGWKVLHQ